MTSSKAPVADFYVGRGRNAVYLGSIWGDVDPEKLKAFTRFHGTDDDLYDARKFQRDVASLVASDEFEKTSGPNTWPHAYRTSHDSTWTYCFDAASVHILELGFQVGTVLCNGARKEADLPHFPVKTN